MLFLLDFLKARVVLYKGGKVMKELKFNAKGSDKLNWFSFSRLNQSSWTDMKTQPNNYFSIHGDPSSVRHFFINSVYHGCPKDAGWMVIAVPAVCDWEKRFQPRQSVILYSTLSVHTNWNQYGELIIKKKIRGPGIPIMGTLTWPSIPNAKQVHWK